KVDAEAAQEETAAALAQGELVIQGLEATLAEQQAAYGAALEGVDELKEQRAAWVQWQADKKAEEERLAAEAAAAEKARKAAEAKAKADAEAKAKAEAARRAELDAAAAAA